tara:strand:- start:24 stop:857 length:834 start_codon:yes stop_codon:yes gene_type:complete
MDTYSLTTVLLDLLSCQRGTENSEVKCQILGEYINNPFLDDDVNSLSLRTGLSRDVLAPILSTLREEGFLKSAGHRGHMLASTDYKHSNQINVKDKGLEPVPISFETETVQWSIDAFLNASSTAMVFMYGEFVYVNASFRQLFGLADIEVTLKKLVELFGFDPRSEIDKSETSISLVLEPGIEVQLRKSSCGEREGILAVLSTDPLSWEMSYTHGQLQEDLFEQLKSHVAIPTELLKAFLRSPEETKLESARSAIEEIDQFLKSYMLSKPNRDEKGH